MRPWVSSDAFLISFAGLMVVIDQITKYLVRVLFYQSETLTIAPFIHLTYLTNTGVAFSMFQGKNMLFAGLAFAAIILFCYWYYRNRSAMPAAARFAFMLIISGAVGNFIDRLAHGHVIDFIDVGFGPYHWPAFNVADSCITVGGILIAYTLLRHKEAWRI